MHSLEAACNKAQILLEKAKNPSSLQQALSSGSTAGPSWSPQACSSNSVESSRKCRVFNIHHRLRELYLEQCRNAHPSHSPLKNIKRGSRLLEKLVVKENLNTLIVNLYPGNKGYSLSLRLQGKVPVALGSQAGRTQGSESVEETMRWPYSDEELLRCIDNEEIPATLVDFLETNHSELFYQGCVIAEIRDYRMTFPLFHFETHHVLLKPTTQSIINDVNLISATQDFSSEDRLSLESQMVLATAAPLCLDPSPAVGIFMNNLQQKRQRLNTKPFRRAAKKFSQVTMNRKRKLDQFTSHNTLQLHDFITRKKAKLKTTNQGKLTKKVSDNRLPTPPPVPTEDLPILAPPSIEPDVLKYAKHYDKPRETTDCTAQLVEEYILETERGQNRIYHIKLTILQRASNSEYLGELYVDRDYKEGEQNGASCRFVLGTRAHANRYIQQFTEIFTEEGRKSVRIIHAIPGQQHRVSYTPGMRERTASAQQQAATAGQPATSQQKTNTHLQHILPNPAQMSIQTPHIQIAPSTINFNLNQQHLQKIQGQITNSQSSTNQPIQINSVSHLTSLLSSNVPGPPNVNVHQIQNPQNLVNVQNLGISNSNLTNSALHNLLTNALSSNVASSSSASLLSDSSTSAALQNGPVSSGGQLVTSAHNIGNSQPNATVHHQPTQSQMQQQNIQASKPTRQPMTTNPQITALVTSLMNSAQQFQAQAAHKAAISNSQPTSVQTTAATSTSQQNSAILSLLNATTPLNINNNVISTSNLNQQSVNQKLLARKTALTNLLNSRLLSQSALNNNVGNALVVNNSSPLRLTLSSLGNFMTNAPNQNSTNQSQILNIGNNSNSSGFTIASTQGATQTSNITTQTFTITNPNSAQNQTYTITAPAIGNLTQPQTQTFTLTPNNSNLVTQSFTISPATSSSNFTISPSNNNFSLSSGPVNVSQPQTFTVLQPNQNLGNQSFTITAPVVTMGNQSFTVTNTPSTVASQAFTITNNNLTSVQSQTFQINNPGTTNQTFTIATPVVTVGSQFVNSQSPALNPNPSPSQTFTINAPSPQGNAPNVFTVNSPVSNQVFTVNIPSPAPTQNQNYSQTQQSKLNQSGKNQTFTINAQNQNFTVTAPLVNNQSFGGATKSEGGRLSAASRSTTQQRRLSQPSQNSELNKLLSERTEKYVGDKSERSGGSDKTICQVLSDNRISQVITDNRISLSETVSNTNSANSTLGLSMPGLSALLAGTPSADNPIPGVSNSSSSSLLDRLASSTSVPPFTSPPSFTPQSPNISAPSPNQNINFQNSSFSSSPNNTFNAVNTNSPLPNLTSPNVPNLTSPSPKSQVQLLGASPNPKEGIGITSPLSSPPGSAPVSLLQGLSLQGISGLQNVQVSIPGLAAPISLALNVAGQHGSGQGVLMTSMPVATTTNTSTTTTAAPTMVLTNSASGTGNVLSLPVAQLMTSGVKSTNQRTTTTPTSISLPQGTGQPMQLVSTLQRPNRSNATQIQGPKAVQAISSRGILNSQRQTVKTTPQATQMPGSQVLTLTAQQQFQLALQKQAQLQNLQCLSQQNQKRPISPASVANKHRRRSNAADPNK